MPDGQKSICRHCEDKEAELYIKQEFELQELKVDFARLWTQCQRCQGNMQEKVICSNSGMYCWLRFICQQVCHQLSPSRIMDL